MTSGNKEHAVHDTRHMAVDAPAALRRRAMMRVLLEPPGVTCMTLQAHLIGPFAEFQRRGIRCGILRMWIVAIAAMSLPHPVARGTHQSFSNERCFPEPAVFIEGPAGKLRQ